ncbi:MAG: hypothetical protein AAFZ07_16840 [Actinomycetota bacterium]
MPTEVDHDRLLAEIDAEVRRRRTSGDLPADFERDLQLTFARFAPPAAVAEDLDALIEGIERASFVDVDASVESVHPIVARVKLVVRKAVAFQMRHVAAQIGGLGHAIAMALRSFADRLDHIERAVPGLDPEVERLSRSIRPAVGTAVPVEMVTLVFDGVDGRIAHLGAGDGSTVTGARNAGLDAYGIEADARLVDELDDVRVDDPLDHLGRVPVDSLAGALLSVPELAVGAHVRLLDEAMRAVRPGGRLLVVTIDPAAWREGLDEVSRDLVTGAPLSALTWKLLLEQRGCLVDEHQVVTNTGVHGVAARLPDAP